jgi:hypothetical protein
MNAQYCHTKLNGLINFQKPLTSTNPACLYFAVLYNNRDALIHKLLKAGVELGEMKTFQCLDEKCKKAKEAEQHLTFALYRNHQEIKSIINGIKTVVQ